MHIDSHFGAINVVQVVSDSIGFLVFFVVFEVIIEVALLPSFENMRQHVLLFL